MVKGKVTKKPKMKKDKDTKRTDEECCLNCKHVFASEYDNTGDCGNPLMGCTFEPEKDREMLNGKCNQFKSQHQTIEELNRWKSIMGVKNCGENEVKKTTVKEGKKKRGNSMDKEAFNEALNGILETVNKGKCVVSEVRFYKTQDEANKFQKKFKEKHKNTEFTSKLFPSKQVLIVAWEEEPKGIGEMDIPLKSTNHNSPIEIFPAFNVKTKELEYIELKDQYGRLFRVKDMNTFMKLDEMALDGTFKKDGAIKEIKNTIKLMKRTMK